MGGHFEAMIVDIARGWIGSSDSDDGPLVAMTEEQITEWDEMERRHQTERQTFLRTAFHAAR